MIGAFVGGIAGLIGYSLVKVIQSGKKSAVQTEEIVKTVKVADPTVQHLTCVDTLMGLLGTTNDDRALLLVDRVVLLAISRKEKSEQRISLRKLVEQSINEIKHIRKFKSMLEFCEEAKKLGDLADLITRHFVTKNPIKEAELSTVELKDVEDNLIYDQMLSSYKSVGLTASKLVNKSGRRAAEKAILEQKVVEYLASKSGSEDIIRRKNIVHYFGEVDTEKAWAYMRSNRDSFMKRYNVKIALRDSGTRGFKGDHSYFEPLFVSQSVGASGDLFFDAKARVRRDLKSCTVLAGSIARFQVSDSYDRQSGDKAWKDGKTPNTDFRAKLIAEGVWERVETGYRFTRDYDFTSTSIAGTMVCGVRVSGHTVWLVEGSSDTLTKHIETLQQGGGDTAA